MCNHNVFKHFLLLKQLESRLVLREARQGCGEGQRWAANAVTQGQGPLGLVSKSRPCTLVPTVSMSLARSDPDPAGLGLSSMALSTCLLLTVDLEQDLEFCIYDKLLG